MEFLCFLLLAYVCFRLSPNGRGSTLWNLTVAKEGETYANGSSLVQAVINERSV